MVSIHFHSCHGNSTPLVLMLMIFVVDWLIAMGPTSRIPVAAKWDVQREVGVLGLFHHPQRWAFGWHGPARDVPVMTSGWRGRRHYGLTGGEDTAQSDRRISVQRSNNRNVYKYLILLFETIIYFPTDAMWGLLDFMSAVPPPPASCSSAGPQLQALAVFPAGPQQQPLDQSVPRRHCKL